MARRRSRSTSLSRAASRTGSLPIGSRGAGGSARAGCGAARGGGAWPQPARATIAARQRSSRIPRPYRRAFSDYHQRMLPDEQVEEVRRFNRTVTQRVGALSDRFLARDRPLGEARVLWEIGPDGCEVRALRNRLGMDSGQLSRLLRSLEAAGMVRLAPSPADRRIRVARLTDAGLSERALLDARSDELAASMLAPLAGDQRERLVGAMRDVERLLTFAGVEIRPV